MRVGGRKDIVVGGDGQRVREFGRFHLLPVLSCNALPLYFFLLPHFLTTDMVSLLLRVLSSAQTDSELILCALWRDPTDSPQQQTSADGTTRSKQRHALPQSFSPSNSQADYLGIVLNPRPEPDSLQRGARSTARQRKLAPQAQRTPSGSPSLSSPCSREDVSSPTSSHLAGPRADGRLTLNSLPPDPIHVLRRQEEQMNDPSLSSRLPAHDHQSPSQHSHHGSPQIHNRLIVLLPPD